MLNDVASCMQPPLLYVTDSQAHSHCDVTHVMSCAAGRAMVSHRTIIVVYIEFAWNYAGFDSNYYFMRLTQLWKSPNYANKSLNYSSIGDSWIPVLMMSCIITWFLSIRLVRSEGNQSTTSITLLITRDWGSCNQVSCLWWMPGCYRMYGDSSSVVIGEFSFKIGLYFIHYDLQTLYTSKRI